MARFSHLACGGCPPVADLLLAIAGEFRDVDAALADERLDELARPLFGLADEPRAAASALARVLDRAPGFAVRRLAVAGLWLDQVLEARAGHPLLLAAVAAETGRRAGLSVHVLSTATGWYAGVAGDERLWLVDTTMDGRRVDARRLRPHCAHEVAFATLLGLSERFEKAGDSRRAGRAALMREQLPLLKRPL
jgi:regulator of sirC expression with transglutaminase-like and TPR domain